MVRVFWLSVIFCFDNKITITEYSINYINITVKTYFLMSSYESKGRRSQTKGHQYENGCHHKRK